MNFDHFSPSLNKRLFIDDIMHKLVRTIGVRFKQRNIFAADKKTLLRIEGDNRSIV